MTRGFTIIELLVVIGIGVIILSTTSVLLLSGQRKVTKISFQEQMLSDIKSVQINAMTGQNGGGAKGVYFGEDSYTLFSGTSHDSQDPGNFVIDIGQSIQLETTFPGSVIVFLGISGEIANYNSNFNTLTIVDKTDNSSQVISFNKYGVAVSQN